MSTKTILFVVFIFSICVARGDSATIYVPDNYSTIQNAVDSAKNGDTVIVRAGSYVENIDFNGKLITLSSECGPEVTLIDGNQNETVVLFTNGETKEAVLRGFTITNGRGSYRAVTNWYYGGGIRCHNSSPIIEENIIEYNSVRGADGGHGGGVYLHCSDAIVRNNKIQYNAAWEGGGLSFLGGCPTIEYNDISRNCGWNGGGISIFQGAAVIRNNTVFKNVSNFCGGGIICSDHSNALIDGNYIIENNGAGGAGGIFVDTWSSPIIANNLIKENYLKDDPNSGGGGISVGCYADVVLINNTLVGNHAHFGGGLLCSSDSKTLALNTIFWNNDASVGSEVYVKDFQGWPPAILNIGYSVVMGGQKGVHVDPLSILNWGAGMIEIDPLFCDEVNGDYHVQRNSPCIDAGVVHSSLPRADFEGDNRLALYGIDIGCDEYDYHLYFTGDAFPVGKMGINVVGAPGQAVTLGMGQGVYSNPVQTPYGELFLVLPIKATLSIGNIPSDGILTRRYSVPAIWTPGQQFPFQALIGQLGGSLAKLSNLVVFDVEEEKLVTPEYKHDDGSCEELFGLQNGGDLCWLQKYNAIPGKDIITSVNQLYGSFVYPFWSPPNGHPCEVFVWNDPTNDGNPSDCVLLTREPTTVQNVNKNVMTTIPLTIPVQVDDQFYVGCVMTLSVGIGGASADMTTVYEPGLTFFCSAATPGTFNPVNLMANSAPPSDAGVFMCIRAGY